MIMTGNEITTAAAMYSPHFVPPSPLTKYRSPICKVRISSWLVDDQWPEVGIPITHEGKKGL